MLNATCYYSDPLHVTILHWFTTTFSIAIYGIAFMVLLMKYPKSFKQYQNLLLAHTASGFLLDWHLRVIWKLNVFLPFAIMCSNGYFAEYAPIGIELFVVFMCFVGWTAVWLFQYRMRAATVHVDHPTFQKMVIYSNYLFHVGSYITFIFTLMIYWDLKDQRDYKAGIEQKLGLPLEGFMWCENCYFIRFDTWRFLSFYVSAYIALSMAFVAILSAAFETFRSLSSKNLKLSAKTAALQRNFLYSLISMVLIHLVFLLTPLSIHFVAQFVPIYSDLIPPIFIAFIQDHGSGATLTMLITNNLLREKAKEFFFIFGRFVLCRPAPKVIDSNLTSVQIFTVTS